MKECPRGKDNLGRLWELLKILRRGAETTKDDGQDLWMDDLDNLV